MAPRPPAVAASVRPVTSRLAKIEKLLTGLQSQQEKQLGDLRREQQVQLQRIAMLQVQLDELTATVNKKLKR